MIRRIQARRSTICNPLASSRAATNENVPLTFVEYVPPPLPLASNVGPETEVCVTCQENCIIDGAPLEERQLARVNPRRTGNAFFPREGGGEDTIAPNLFLQRRIFNYYSISSYSRRGPAPARPRSERVSRSTLISRVASENH